MEIIKRPLGLYKANCYVLKQDNLSLIIDPGFHSRHIIDMVGDTTPLAVVLTHGHCDHVSALDEICEHYKIPAYLHKGDHELLQLIRRRPSVYKKKMFTQCISLHEGSLEIGPFKFYVYHTPGHSAGSVCLQIENHYLLVIPYLNKMWEIVIIIMVMQMIYVKVLIKYYS